MNEGQTEWWGAMAKCAACDEPICDETYFLYSGLCQACAHDGDEDDDEPTDWQED